MTRTIYALTCPATGAIRYIGQTSQDPRARLGQMVYAARQGAASVSAIWILELLELGFRPGVIGLEVCEDDRADDAEREWIARHWGVSLKNMAAGGPGSVGVVPGPRTRELLSRAAKGRKQTPEWIEKRTAASRGRTRSDELRARLSSFRKGNPAVTGANHPGAKLTTEQVATIRSRFTGARGELTELAREYGVTATHVRRLVKGEQRSLS